MTAGWRRFVDPALDADLLAAVEAGAPWAHRVWEAGSAAVVLGRGTPHGEANTEACQADGVPILRRLGGGGAVVLAPGCVVVSLAAAVERELDVGGYLGRIASFLSEALGEITGLPLVVRGTGDLCLGDRKVLGSSLFRRRRLLFYGASLLHSMDVGRVERYLAHPGREPEYRRGRPHGEFLTTFVAEGARTPVEDLCSALEKRLPALAEGLE